MSENYYLKLLLGNQDLPGVSVPFAAAPMPKAPTPPPQRKPAQEDIIPEARAPISKPAYQNPESAPSPMKEKQAFVGNEIPTMKEAFQNYYESQNKIPELFMKKYEALESQRQADREELDAMKAKTFEGWRNKDLTPLMALTDSLTGSNLTRSYKAPTAEAENKAKIAAMENYLRKNAGQLSDVEIMAGKQDAMGDKVIYDMLRQESKDGMDMRLKFMNAIEKSRKEKSGQTDQVQKLRKEWLSLPTTKDTQSVSVAFQKVKSGAETPTAAGDMGMIFNFMKMLDPGSVVREGEFANAQNATGVPSRVINIYNQILSGQRLNPEQRQDFLNQAQKVFDAQMIQQKRINDQYSSLAQRQGFAPTDVVLDFFENLNPEQKQKGANKSPGFDDMTDEELDAFLAE